MCYDIEDEKPVAVAPKKPAKKPAKGTPKKVVKKTTKKPSKGGVNTEKPASDLMPQDLESLLDNIEQEIEAEQSGIAPTQGKKVAKSA